MTFPVRNPAYPESWQFAGHTVQATWFPADVSDVPEPGDTSCHVVVKVFDADDTEHTYGPDRRDARVIAEGVGYTFDEAMRQLAPIERQPDLDPAAQPTVERPF